MEVGHILGIVATVLLSIFALAVTIGLYIVKNIRDDVRTMKFEVGNDLRGLRDNIHDFVVLTERRLTTLEVHVGVGVRPAPREQRGPDA